MLELAPGTVFAGHRIDAVAGRGGMGIVYRATHLALELSVALKIIAPEYAEDELFRERFKLESRLAAGIDNPHVIPIRDAGEEEGLLYVTMRFVEGTDLRKLIGTEGRLDPALAVEIVGQVAEGLDAAHAAGLVHRDVKPANVLIETRRDLPHAYLTDFGLVHREDATRGLTGTGVWVGTVDYASPEQIRGAKVDARTDVYALGCVLYAALAGEAPFARETPVATVYAHTEDPIPMPSQRVPGLPGDLDAVLTRALAKDPADRYQSAGQLGRAAMAAVPEEAPRLAAEETAPASAAETRALPKERAPGSAAETRPVPKPAAPTRPLRRGEPGRPRRPGRLLAVLGAIAVAAAVVGALALGGGGGNGDAVPDGGGGGGQGGGGGGNAAEEIQAFRDRADGVCTSIERRVEEAENRIGPDTVSLLRERADIVRAGVDELEGLRVPGQLREELADYAGTRRSFAAALDQLADAQESGSSTAAANERLEELFDRKVELGKEMSLQACADRLPAADRRQVQQVAASWLSGTDAARTCAGELTTTEFGTSASCLDYAARGSGAAVAEPATGVHGVRATVDLDVGGAVYRLQLAFVDGTWRVDGARPL